jgi:transcriptional regulator with XRE-family HTH domain
MASRPCFEAKPYSERLEGNHAIPWWFGNQMRTFGEVIAEARKKAHLTQRQLAAHIRNEEGKGISGPYLNDIEHNFRHPPRGYLLEQFARELDLDIDLLYFLAKQLPVEIDINNVSEEQGVAAYRAFRLALKRNGKKKR